MPQSDPCLSELASLERIDQICVQFEQDWQADNRPSLEAFLTQGLPEDHDALLFELLSIEIAYLQNRDQAWHWNDYYQRFPDDRDCIDAVADYHHRGESGTTLGRGPLHSTSPLTLPDKIRYIGNYEILAEIARGGMGVVFKARQTRLDRVVALKMLLSSSMATPTAVRRFRHEARTAASLNHPRIVPIHEVGEFTGHPWYTMEYIDGPSMDAEIRRGPLEPVRAARLVRQIAETVEYAHQQGVLHRDLKPANILLDRSDSPMITDFGLAKLNRITDSIALETLTATGQIVGTPSYMSPEQAGGCLSEVGEGTDVWALGGILYACLTGRPPFAAASAVDTLLQVMRHDPVEPRSLNPSAPRDLATICLKCLSKDPRHRYRSASELADDLQRFESSKPVRARPVSTVARVWRWGKRNPASAMLSVLSLFLLIAGTAVSAVFAITAEQRAEALQGAQTKIQAALAEKEIALTEADELLKELRWSNYQGQMDSMRLAWMEQDFGRLRELLKESCPRPDQPELRDWEWYFFLNEVNQQSQVVVSSADSPYRSFGLSHDRSRIALRRKNGSIDIIDATTAHVIMRLAVKGQQHFAWQPGGDLLAISNGSGGVELWDSYNAERTHTFPAAVQSEISNPSIAWHPDGMSIAVGGRGQVCQFFLDEREPAILQSFPPFVLTTLAWHPEGKLLAASGVSYTAVVNANTDHLVWKHFQSRVPVPDLAWSGRGDRLATVWRYPAHRVRVFDLDGQVTEFPQTKSEMTSVTWIDNDQRIATTSDNQTLRIWDANRKSLLDLRRLAGSPMASTAWDQTKAKLYCLDHVGTLHAVDFKNEQRQHHKLPLDEGKIWNCCLRPNDSSWLLTISGKDARIHDLNDLRLVQSIEVAGIKAHAWHPQLPQIITVDKVGELVIWDIESGQPVKRQMANSRVWTRYVGFSFDGKLIGLGSGLTWQQPPANEFEVWDPLDFRVISSRPGKKLKTIGEFRPGSHSFAYIASNGTGPVQLVDAATGATLAESQNFDDVAAGRFAFDTTGDRLAIPFHSGRIAILAAESLEEMASRVVHSGRFRKIFWTPSGKRIIACTTDNELLILDPHNLELVVKLSNPSWGSNWDLDPASGNLINVDENGSLQVVGVATLNQSAEFERISAVHNLGPSQQ